MPTAIANLFIQIEGSIAKFSKDMGKVGDSLDKFGNRTRQLGMKMSALSLPVAGIAGASLKMAGDFEASMNKVSARGQIFGDTLKQLEAQALKLGAATMFSAKEAADGMADLAAAGFDANKIAAAMPGVLDFAAASQMAVAEASLITVDTLGQFGLAADQAGRVADVMSAAANASQIEMSDLAMSMKYVGPVANAMGLSLEETSAMLALMGEAGIRADTAGTSLRMGLKRLIAPPKAAAEALQALGISATDSSGKLKDLPTLLDEFGKHANDPKLTSYMAKIFGAEAMPAWIAAVGKGGDKLREYEKITEGSTGAAQRMAEILRKGLNGSLERMRGSVETAGIALGKIMAPSAEVLAGVLEGLANKVTQLASWFETMPGWVKHAASAMVGLAVVVGPLTIGIGFLAQGFGGFMSAMSNFPILIAGVKKGFGLLGSLFTLLKGSLALLLTPMGAVLAAVGAFAVAAYLVYDNWDTIGPWLTKEWNLIKLGLETIWNKISENWNSFWTGFDQGVAVLKQKWTEFWTDFGNGVAVIQQKITELKDYFVQGFNGMVEAVTDMVNRIKTEIHDRLVGILESVKAPIDKVAGWFAGLYDSVVGHSYIPDMVERIRQEMKALEGEAMVTPAKNATSKTGDQFDALEKRVAGSSKRMKGHLQAINEEINDIFDDRKVVADPLQKGIEELIKANDVKGLRELGAAWSTNAETAKQFRDALGEAKKATSELHGSQRDLGDEVKRTGDAISAAFGKEHVAPMSDLAQQIQGLITSGDESGLRALYDSMSGSADESERFNNALEAAKGNIDRLAQKSEAWTSAMAGAIGQLAQAFGITSELANGLGQFAASAMSGSSQGGGEWGQLGASFGSLFSSSGSEMSTADAHSQGIQGPGGEDGSFNSGAAGGGGYDYAGAFAGVAQGLGSFFGGGSERDRKNKDNRETGGAVGTAAGAVIGAFFGAPQVGAVIGNVIGSTVGGFLKTGSQNAETLARHAFANYIEEQFQKLGTVSFFDAKGVLRQQKGDQFNFLEGSRGRFDPMGDTGGTNWGDNFQAMGDKAVAMFTGLGQGFKSLLGITEDVAGQIGYLLATNLNGNIDNARLLVQQLGIAQEDFLKALEASAVKGDITWHDYNVSVAAVTEAYKEGLSASGAYAQAFNNLRESGGRGMAAIKSFRDIAVEALESGVKSMDELKAKMIAEGADPAEVEALFAAAAQRGISTLEGWKEASNATAGAIVGDMYALSSSLASKWDEMKNTLEDVYKTLDQIPDKVEKSVTVDVRVNDPEGALDKLEGGNGAAEAPVDPTVKAARGGILKNAGVFAHSKGLGLMGEAGPEAIMPLARVGGKLGVAASLEGGGKNFTVVVHAPYSDAGSADHIKNTVLGMKDYIVSEALEAMYDEARRSGYFGR